MLRVWGMSGAELCSLTKEELTEELKVVADLKLHLRKLHGFPPCLQELLDGSRKLEDAVTLETPWDMQLLLKTSSTGTEAAKMSMNMEFFEAAFKGPTEAVQLLLAAGADLDFRTSGTPKL